jgi:hypothetical protein
MDTNDQVMANNQAELLLLIDSSAYLCMQEIAAAIGTHPLDLLGFYPNIDFYFSSGMINELIKGREGLNALPLFQKSLQDEGAAVDDTIKDNRVLYNAKDGSVKFAVLNMTSYVDSGQILLCQNHPQLVLLTNDHNMIKNAAAVLDRRLMDILNLLELMIETPDKKIRDKWVEIKSYFDTTGYKRPKYVRSIPDRQLGELPKHFRDTV